MRRAQQSRFQEWRRRVAKGFRQRQVQELAVGHWTINEGAVAGEEVQGGQRDGVGCQHAWGSCWGPWCTSVP